MPQFLEKNSLYKLKIKSVIRLTVGTACLLFSIAGYPNSFNALEASLHDLQHALKSKQVTSLELVDAYLARINAYDQQNAELNAIIHINPNARKRASELDQERKTKGTRGPLHGIPVIVKDNYNTVDLPTTAGSVALAGFVPSSDAFQVAKLRQAGAIILAKANMDEHAFNNDGISSLGGQTKNAYDPSRNPGGSSAGTAVAIASNFAAVGLGTDTCGSIAIPAALNNLVGLRPSKGLTSVSGVIPASHLTDVTGPMTRTVKDLAILMDLMVGYDKHDPATQLIKERTSPGFVGSLGSRQLSTLRLGRLTQKFEDNGFYAAKVIDKAIAYLPYVERLDAYTFKFVAKDMVEACKFLRFVLKSGALTLKA